MVCQTRIFDFVNYSLNGCSLDSRPDKLSVYLRHVAGNVFSKSEYTVIKIYRREILKRNIAVIVTVPLL